MFSAHDDVLTMRKMEEAGAAGYLVKGRARGDDRRVDQTRGYRLEPLARPPRGLTRGRSAGFGHEGELGLCVGRVSLERDDQRLELARAGASRTALDPPAGRHDLDRAEIRGAAPQGCAG